ncbi:MAG: hypothetical protein Q8P36_01640 [bacterium]|nr:hypothetical protein [bacterium]
MTRERIRDIYRRRGPDAAMAVARATQDPHLIEEAERLSGIQSETTNESDPDSGSPPVRHTPIAYGMSLSELDRLAAARKAAT